MQSKRENLSILQQKLLTGKLHLSGTLAMWQKYQGTDLAHVVGTRLSRIHFSVSTNFFKK